MKKIIAPIFSFVLLIMSLNIANASQDSFSLAIINVSALIKTVTGIAFSLAFLGFFWGMFKYLGTHSEQEKKDAVSIMATSIAIIFIMVSVWGLISLLSGTLGTKDSIDHFRPPKALPVF